MLRSMKESITQNVTGNIKQNDAWNIRYRSKLAIGKFSKPPRIIAVGCQVSHESLAVYTQKPSTMAISTFERASLNQR